jgi:hypothetical protein
MVSFIKSAVEWVSALVVGCLLAALVIVPVGYAAALAVSYADDHTPTFDVRDVFENGRAMTVKEAETAFTMRGGRRIEVERCGLWATAKVSVGEEDFLFVAFPGCAYKRAR